MKPKLRLRSKDILIVFPGNRTTAIHRISLERDASILKRMGEVTIGLAVARSLLEVSNERYPALRDGIGVHGRKALEPALHLPPEVPPGKIAPHARQSPNAKLCPHDRKITQHNRNLSHADA